MVNSDGSGKSERRSGRKTKFYLSLSFQVIALILAGLIATALIQYYYAEEIIETTILDETKRQAYVFLLGIEREVQSLDDPFDEQALNEFLQKAHSHDVKDLHFSIINIYMYDMQGNVIASVRKRKDLKKDLSGHYGDVLGGTSYLGTEIEKDHISEDGRVIPSTDVIVPVRYDGVIVGGLEVEIDLEKTFVLIKETDNKYENKIVIMLGTAMVLSIVFIWLIMHWRLVSPVRDLGAITRLIAQGDLEARIRSPRRDEIGFLSSSVDTMADSIQNLIQELDRAYIGTLSSLSTALEARDEYTAHHSENVTSYSLLLGRRIGLDKENLNRLSQGAMLHDLGKIGVPDHILNKPGRLTPEERAQVESHTRITAEILAPVEKFKHFSDIARFHHERWDGKGYPDGLEGDDIPLLARIVSIADTWDAMTTDRLYRKGMSADAVISILEKERNDGQWDPRLLDEFLLLMRQGRGPE